MSSPECVFAIWAFASAAVAGNPSVSRIAVSGDFTRPCLLFGDSLGDFGNRRACVCSVALAGFVGSWCWPPATDEREERQSLAHWCANACSFQRLAILVITVGGSSR
jgi:hypothetical protein